MPSFIVKKSSFSKDGSGKPGQRTIVMVHTATAEAARIEGAAMLECSPSQVTVEQFNG